MYIINEIIQVIGLIALVAILSSVIVGLFFRRKRIELSNEITELWTEFDNIKCATTFIEDRPISYWKKAQQEYPDAPTNGNFAEFLKWAVDKINEIFPYNTNGKAELLNNLEWGWIHNVVDFWIYVMHWKIYDSNKHTINACFDEINNIDDIQKNNPHDNVEPTNNHTIENEGPSLDYIGEAIEKPKKSIKKKNKNIIINTSQFHIPTPEEMPDIASFEVKGIEKSGEDGEPFID